MWGKLTSCCYQPMNSPDRDRRGLRNHQLPIGQSAAAARIAETQPSLKEVPCYYLGYPENLTERTGPPRLLPMSEKQEMEFAQDYPSPPHMPRIRKTYIVQEPKRPAPPPVSPDSNTVANDYNEESNIFELVYLKPKDTKRCRPSRPYDDNEDIKPGTCSNNN